MADLTRDDILKLASLARLQLSDAEAKSLEGEINIILNYIIQLQSVNVNDLQPTSQVTGLTNVMRDDVVRDYGVSQVDLLKNVPQVDGDLIKVKRMLG